MCAQATEQASRATTQAVTWFDAAATELTGPPSRPARGGATSVPGQAGHHSGFWSGVLHGAEHLGVDLVNATASLGNGIIHDPGGVFAILGGIGLAGISTGGEAVGIGLDATGVGAVAGVPLNALSAAGIASGTALAGAGAAAIMRDAAGPDRVTLMQSQSDGELPQTAHGAERASDPSRLGPEAQAEVVANPTQTFTQGDNAQVFVQKVGDRYNVVVLGDRGVISNLKTISQRSLDRLAASYKWKPN